MTVRTIPILPQKRVFLSNWLNASSLISLTSISLDLSHLSLGFSHPGLPVIFSWVPAPIIGGEGGSTGWTLPIGAESILPCSSFFPALVSSVTELSRSLCRVLHFGEFLKRENGSRNHMAQGINEQIGTIPAIK